MQKQAFHSSFQSGKDLLGHVITIFTLLRNFLTIAHNDHTLHTLTDLSKVLHTLVNTSYSVALSWSSWWVWTGVSLQVFLFAFTVLGICWTRTSCKLGIHSTTELCIPSLFLVFILRQDFSKLPRLDINSLCSPCWSQICTPPALVSQGSEITYLHHGHGSLLSDTIISCLAGMTMPCFSSVCLCSLCHCQSPGWMEVNPWTSCCTMVLPAFISKPGKVSRHVQLVAMDYMS